MTRGDRGSRNSAQDIVCAAGTLGYSHIGIIAHDGSIVEARMPLLYREKQKNNSHLPATNGAHAR